MDASHQVLPHSGMCVPSLALRTTPDSPSIPKSTPTVSHPDISFQRMERKRNAHTVDTDPKRCIFGCWLGCNRQHLKLTPNDIQEAILVHSRPIKNDEPKPGPHTKYSQEASEYDAEYVQKYDRDFDAASIFVRFCVHLTSTWHRLRW